MFDDLRKVGGALEFLKMQQAATKTAQNSNAASPLISPQHSPLRNAAIEKAFETVV